MKTLLRVALGGLFAGAGFSAFGATTDLLVKFTPNASPKLINAAIGARVIDEFPQIGWMQVRLPQSVSVDRGARYYRSLSTVSKVELPVKHTIFATRTPNDPLYAQQYQHVQIGMPSAWALSIGSPSVTVAIIDSGVLATHEDLAANVRTDGYNFSENDTDSSPRGFHGTHVAGDAAGIANNGVGGAGTAWNVKILPIRIFPNSYSYNSAKAMIYAADKGVQVLNMSYGGQGRSDIEGDAVAYAYSKDVVLVAAAGNDGDMTINYPSSWPLVLNVAATKLGGSRASFSTYGPTVKVAAPGEDIMSTVGPNNNSYESESGTSMASPITAGAVALLRAYSPQSSNTEVIKALTDTATQATTPFTTYGQINVAAAIVALVPPQVVDLDPTTTSVVATEGTIVNTTGAPSTDASFLANADNNPLEVRANYKPQIGTVAGVTTDFSVPAPTSRIITSRMQMSVKAASGVTMLVMLQNASTGAYELFTSARLSATTSVIDLPLPKATLLRYVKSNGSMRVQIRAINPSRLSPGGVAFRMSLDSVGLKVSSNVR